MTATMRIWASEGCVDMVLEIIEGLNMTSVVTQPKYKGQKAQVWVAKENVSETATSEECFPSEILDNFNTDSFTLI